MKTEVLIKCHFSDAIPVARKQFHKLVVNSSVSQESKRSVPTPAINLRQKCIPVKWRSPEQNVVVAEKVGSGFEDSGTKAP